MSQIAIASVPIQKWEKPYNIKEALCKGSIFPELHKPFYVEEQMETCTAKPLNEREARLLEIQQVTFSLIDLQLFLDLHPEEAEGKEMKSQLQTKRRELMEAFAKDYYPLTCFCQGDQKEEVAPWGGGGKKHVEL